MKFEDIKTEKSSIRNKLRKISTINAAVILLLCWLLLFSTSMLFIKSYEKRNLELIANTLSTSLTAATVFEDSYDAKKKVLLLGSQGMFSAAKLTSSEQTVLVDWQDNTNDDNRFQRTLRHWIYAEPLTVNVTHEDAVVGKLTLSGTVTNVADFIEYSVIILSCSMIFVFIVSFLVSELLHRGILASFRNITSTIHYVIRSGDFSPRISGSSTKEFQVFSEDLNSLLAEMQTLKASLLRDNKSLAAKALKDPLTGLANRTAFISKLNQLLDQQLAQENFVLLFLDGDRFKSINDTWGHAAGDEVLQSIAARLSGLVTKSDLVARLGGDEFAILITSMTSEEELQQLTARIETSITQKIAISAGVNISTSVTIGYAWSQHGDSVTSILERADMHMYKNKGITKVSG